MSVLCANAPGAALHVVLREREDGHEASREHGGGGVRLPLSETDADLSVKGLIDWSHWARAELLRGIKWMDVHRHFTDMWHWDRGCCCNAGHDRGETTVYPGHNSVNYAFKKIKSYTLLVLFFRRSSDLNCALVMVWPSQDEDKSTIRSLTEALQEAAWRLHFLMPLEWWMQMWEWC